MFSISIIQCKQLGMGLIEILKRSHVEICIPIGPKYIKKVIRYNCHPRMNYQI